MDGIDAAIALYLNGYARLSGTFDEAMVLLYRNQLVKSGIVVPALWYLWFHPAHAKRREVVLGTLAAAFAGLLVARALALLLPFRPRPIHDARLDLTVPYGLEPRELEIWSAFPSDHAVLYVALAVGLFAVSRRLGAFAVAYVVLVVLWPRLYLGLHFLSDLLAGAVIGALLAAALTRPAARAPIARVTLPWAERHPGLFYAGFFVLAWRLATLFNDVRAAGEFAVEVLQRIIGRP